LDAVFGLSLRWIERFLGCLQQAIQASEVTLQAILTKARFWESHSGQPINGRQRLLLNRLLDGFEGTLTSSKWALIAKCSQDTALRDIGDLVERWILVRQKGGWAEHPLRTRADEDVK
jgi:Fic family protein